MSKNELMSHSLESNCLIVQVKQSFDETNCFKIQDQIFLLLKKNPSHLLLDLNEVTVIRSSGLRVILFLAKNFSKQDKKFALIYSKNNSNQQVAQILEVSGFTKIIPICGTKKTAIESCTASP